MDTIVPPLDRINTEKISKIVHVRKNLYLSKMLRDDILSDKGDSCDNNNNNKLESKLKVPGHLRNSKYRKKLLFYQQKNALYHYHESQEILSFHQKQLISNAVFLRDL